MAVFFRPSDITTLECSVNNVTRGGSAFAVCEDGEQVFITPKIVDIMKIEVGDLLTAYCIDNKRDEVEDPNRFAVRWRAIRVTVTERFMPEVEPPKPAAPLEDMPQRLKRFLANDRAWTAVQLAEASGDDLQKVASWLQYHSGTGEVASMKLYRNGSQEHASAVYYGKDLELFIDLIDGVTLED